jgi:hypothetical protein
MDTENINIEELNYFEMENTEGGWYILRITGLFDGIKGNTDFDWFNFD